MADIIKNITDFTTNFVNTNSKNEYTYTPSTSGISEILIQSLFDFFVTKWGGKGTLDDYMRSIGVTSKNKVVVEYLAAEKELFVSSCEVIFSLTGHLNVTDRILYKRIIRNNVAIKRFIDTCEAGNEYLKGGDALNFDAQILNAFNAMNQEIGCLFHFVIASRSDIAKRLAQENLTFFREYQSQITAYEELGIKCDLLFRKDSLLSPDARLNSPQHLETALNTPLPKLEFDEFDMYSNTINERMTIQQSSEFQEELSDLAGLSEMNDKRLLEESIDVVPIGDFLEINLECATDDDVPDKDDISLANLELDSSCHDLTNPDKNTNLIQKQFPKRFVGMLSSNRFSTTTYQSMLRNTNLANEDKFATDQRSENTDKNADSVNVATFPSVPSGSKTLPPNLRPIDPPKTSTNEIPDITDISNLLMSGMKDGNPTIRSHAFLLGEVHDRLSDFLVTLRIKEEEASLLPSATRASDLVLRDIKAEWSRISKTMDRAIQESIKDDADKDRNVSQLQQACMVAKNLCKSSITTLSNKLSLNIGAHADIHQWQDSLKSLPKGMLIQGYSNPSIFCYMVAFLNLLNQNPVQRQIYMPSLYNTLSEKNGTIVSNIRTNYNPGTYKELFQVILEKYASVPTTLQVILGRMDSLGMLTTPTTYQDFLSELDKSSSFQGIFNMIDSWVRILSTFYDHDIMNIILSGPHSSSMIAKLKACYIAEKMSSHLLELSSKSPSEQFHELIAMYTKHHMGLQEYVNQMGPLAPAVNKSLNSERSKASRFREVNNLSESVDDRHISKEKNSNRLTYDNTDSINSDLGKTFDALISQNWEEERIPYKLHNVNLPTVERLVAEGVERKRAELIAKLMLVPCPVCIQYISINIKEINEGSIYLVPHFYLGEPKAYYPPSHKMASCPTFLALDQIERCKIQALLNICEKCTSSKDTNHTCPQNVVTCRNNENVNRILCSCISCMKSINIQRAKCVQVQKEYISSRGQRILMNGGHHNHKANHVVDGANIRKHREDLSEGGYMKDLSKVQTDLQLSSIKELEARVNLDTSLQKRISRFAMVFVKDVHGQDQCLILDTGASCSTMSKAGISKFYHALMESPVSLKVATGDISIHKESVAALPLADKEKHLAVSFLLVEHKFDPIESIDITEISDALYNKYAQECLQKGVQVKFNREDFPNNLPETTPIGLLGIRDFQLNVLVSDGGVIALENCFDSHQSVILAGPLLAKYTANLVRTANINHTDRPMDLASASEPTQSQGQTKTLTERIKIWLDQRSSSKMKQRAQRSRQKKTAVVKPILKANSQQKLRTMKSLESAVKSFGQLVLKYVPIGKAGDIFMTFGIQTLNHLDRNARGQRELLCGNCGIQYCYHCALQRILLSGDVEVNPGPQFTPLSNKWSKALGFDAVIMHASSEQYMCILHSIGMLIPFKTKANPASSARDLKLKLRDYILKDFVNFLKKAKELSAFKDGVMERLTNRGLVKITSMSVYRSLFDIPFYFELLEAIALSEFMKISLKIWLNPNLVNEIGQKGYPTYNLFLNTNFKHYSPIVKLNGETHSLELKKLDKSFSQFHLSLSDFPPLPKVAQEVYCLETGNSSKPNADSKQNIRNNTTNNIITITTSGSEEDIDDDREKWISVSKKKKGVKKHMVPYSHVENKTNSRNEKAKTTPNDDSGSQQQKTEREQNLLSTISWQGVKKFNPFGESSLEGGINRSSFSENLPRRTLLKVDNQNINQTKPLKEGFKQPVDLQQTDFVSNNQPSAEILLAEKDLSANESTEKENLNRPNFFIGFKITGRKFLSDIKIIQDTIVRTDSSLKKELIKPHRMHLTLLALHIKDDKQDLAKAGNILQEIMKDIEEFEINLENIGNFEDSVIFISPKKNDKNLRQMNKKLFTTFTNAGYSCDKRFNPHVSILRGTKLPVDDILKRTRKLKMIGSTEFVDRISLNNMRAKDGNDYYKTESTVKLKEILGCGNAYFNKDQEPAQDQDNTLSLDDNLMNESTNVEIDLDHNESLIKISHLLEPDQRPKSKNVSIRANIGTSANSILKHIKQELKESASEMKNFLVQDEYISFLFHTEKTSSEINKDSFRELLAFPANNLDKFKAKKTEGTLFLELICGDSLDFLKKFTSQNGLSLIRCCIPLIQNNGYRVSSSLIDMDIEKSKIFNVQAPIAVHSLSIFEYDIHLNIEKYIGCVGKANPSKILNISINEVRNIIKNIDNTYDKYSGVSTVLTMGEIIFVYDGTKFETFFFNQSLSRRFINRLKRQLQTLDESKICSICDNNDIMIDPLIHKITQHGLTLPSEITGCILQDDYCEDCTKTEDRILHMIEAHGDNLTVKNCLSFMSKTMQCGIIHQDIGDLYLIPEHKRVVQHIKKVDDQNENPEEVRNMDLYFNEIAFNLPSKVLDWEAKSLTNVYLSFLMIFQFIRICFNKRGKCLKYASIETPNISENFKLFCPILKNSRSFIKFNTLRTKSKSELQTVPSLDQSRGRRLIDMDKNEQRALAIKFHTGSKASLETLKKVRNHCRPYPHVISLTGQLINLAMNIAESRADSPDHEANLENMMIITGYLTGFLTFNQKSNRAIAPILLEDIVASLALVIFKGHKENLIRKSQEVRKRLNEKDFLGEMKLLQSLPEVRLAYVTREILDLNVFRLDLDKPTEVPQVFEISPLHVFPDIESYDEVTKVTDTFLFIRSNLELKTYDTKAAKKWMSQNCIQKDDMSIVSNRISGNRTLSEELINQLDKVGVCYNLIPLHPNSILFTWVFNACHRNHIRIFERPSTRKEQHSGVPLTLQNFMRAFAMCGQNRILSNRVDKCILCKLRRMHYKSGPLGDFQEQSITQEGLGGMYQIDIIPNIKLSPHGGGTTRQKSSINIGVIVCIDRLTRYVILEPLRSRDVGQVILSLESIFIKHGMPRVLFCDQESSVLSIARAQGWPMSSSGFLFKETCELACLFTAATGSAHSQNGVVERMILNIKKSLGGTDYSAIKIDFFAFTQILNTLSDRLNNIPIAIKNVKNSSSGLENMLTPDMLFKGLRYRPIELPELKRGTDNHKLRENMLLTQNILKTFLIEYFSQNKPLKEEELHPDSKFYQEKWIVAFFLEGNSRPFKRCYDTLKIGRIRKYTDYHNRRPRNAIVEFISLCGSPAIKSKVKIFASKRKVSELIYLFKEDTVLKDHVDDEENMIRKLQSTESELINCISIFRSNFLADDELDYKDICYLDTIEELSEEYENIDLNSEKEITLDECNLVDCANENDMKPQEVNSILPEYDQDLENDPDKIQVNNEAVFDRNSIEETLRQYTMSDYCSVSKCPDCPKCFRCKVEKDLSASEIQERKLAAEDPILMDCIRLVKPTEDDADKIRSPLRVACRVPLDPQKIHLLGDNLESVKSEFDNKFAKLSMEEREKFDIAFKDMVNKKVFTKLEDIPKELQDTIMNNKNRHFLSLAPAFKSSSVNTKIRCCLNASKENLRKVSLNSITYKGLNDLDLSRSFRKFRAFPYGVVGDISRFYNGTLLESESYAYQLISYRKDCKPNGEWETYVTSKLSFGIASAAFIATAAITLILDFFRTKCKCFKREELHGVKIGGMDINELDKIDTELDKFNHHDLPTTAGNKNCNAAFHLAESYIASSFVDDLMSSFPVDVRKTVIETTDYILGFFDFKIKGHDQSNTPADPLSETLIAGKLGVAGYSYSPEVDCFQLKHVQMHNGQKFRGKIKRSRWTKEFFYESLDSMDKCTFEYIKNLFVKSETKPTLKLVVSRASSVFDTVGIVSPLKNQIVRLLSTFVIMSKQNWNYVIPEDGFDLFLRMMVELAIASFHEYPRFPKNCINQKLTNIKLLWLSDASPFGSCRSNYYLSYKCANGAIGTHLIHTCNKLTPPMLTVPKAEADSLSAGCEAFYKIFLEFEDVITEAFSGTDSRCLIYWTLDEANRKNVFVNNRCTNLINILKRLPPKVYPKVPDMDETQGWRNLLFWFAGQEDIMTADLGTKYPLFRVKGGSPLINASKVGPESSHFLGPTWFQQDSLASLWEADLCRSAAFYQRNTKAFEELEQDVKEDLVPSSKENSLEEEKELLILDEGKELKKMLTLCVRAVTSPDTCVNRLEHATEDEYLDLDEVTMPKLIDSDTDEEDDYDHDKETKETEVSIQQSDNVRTKSIDNWSYAIMSFIAFMLMIHLVSTNENPEHLLTALNCDGPKKLFDLTRIQECKNGYFSAYTTGHQTEKSFLYQPSKIKIRSVSCTIRVRIEAAVCPRINNINKILGTSTTVSGFKTFSDHFLIVEPDVCHKASTTGMMKLKLGYDDIEIRSIRGETHDFYLGNSGLSLNGRSVDCKPVVKRVYLNTSEHYALMGGKVVKASVTVNLSKEDNFYIMKDDVLLTASDEKISLLKHFENTTITPYLPTITDKKSTTLFYFDNDYRKVKHLKFNNSAQHAVQYDATNSSLPDLVKLTLTSIEGREIVAALQLSKNSHSVDLNSISTSNVSSTTLTCFNSQFEDLMMCDALDLHDRMIPPSPISLFDLLLSKHGGSNSFLQHNIDMSVSGILASLCAETADKMRIIANDFNKLGGLLNANTYESAVVSRDLSEIGEIKSCEPKILAATELRNDNGDIICCKFLPVKHEEKIRFLKPLSRQLTDVCIIEKCDGELGVTRIYITLNGTAIRQSAKGIVKLNTTKINLLNPVDGLDIFKFSPLDFKEHRQSSNIDEATRIRLNYAEDMLNDLSSEISNMMQSASAENTWGIELARELLPSFIFWLITNMYGQIILLTIVIYEALRLLFTVLSILFTITDIIRRKPNNKLEHLINSSTASRRETAFHQQCMDDIQTKLIGDMVSVQAQLRYHSRRIAILDAASRRTEHKYYNEQRYSPLNQTNNSDDDQVNES